MKATLDWETDIQFVLLSGYKYDEDTFDKSVDFVLCKLAVDGKMYMNCLTSVET